MPSGVESLCSRISTNSRAREQQQPEQRGENAFRRDLPQIQLIDRRCLLEEPKPRGMEGAGRMREMRRMPELRAAVFRVSQLALLPVGIVAYLWGVPKLLVYSRRTAVSATLLASLYPVHAAPAGDEAG